MILFKTPLKIPPVPFSEKPASVAKAKQDEPVAKADDLADRLKATSLATPEETLGISFTEMVIRGSSANADASVEMKSPPAPPDESTLRNEPPKSTFKRPQLGKQTRYSKTAGFPLYQSFPHF